MNTKMFDFENIKSILDTLAQNEPVAYAVPLFVVSILIELGLSSMLKLHNYETKDAISSLIMGSVSVFINTATKIFYFIVFSFIYQHYRLFDIPIIWWSWLLLLFADDFSFYWHHRLSHQVRILWAAHSNHHSSQSYNLATALRQSWTEMFYKYIFWIWLPLVGFPPLMIFSMIAMSLIYQFFLHTELIRSMGFLEYFMNTPSHHRVHHATNVKYLDRNHAGIFIIWDKLFGTFEPEDLTDKPIYGLTTNINTYNPIRIASAEYEKIYESLQKTNRFWDKINYLFMPPGWSHDGSTKTTKQLMAERNQKKMSKT